VSYRLGFPRHGSPTLKTFHSLERVVERSIDEFFFSGPPKDPSQAIDRLIDR